MVTTLYLIRHGETEGSETKRYKGSIDVPLSKIGAVQIKDASKFILKHLNNSNLSKHMSYLNDIHITDDNSSQGKVCVDAFSIESSNETLHNRLTAVYCSDLSRAVKSAEIIAEPFGLEPIQLPALRERHFGIWEGMSFIEIKRKYPEEFQAWANDPLRYSPVGGESTIEVSERAVNALDHIIRNHNGENIAIVAHGGINRIILCHIMGISFENIFRIEQDYAAINVIEFWDRYPVVKLINGRWDYGKEF